MCSSDLITVEKLKKATGLTEEEVCDCLSAIPLTQVKSIDQAGDGWFQKAKSESPDWRLQLEDQVSLLSRAIQSLSERERLVVTLYYREDLRLKEIGRLLNLSESRVCRLLSGAQLALREFVAAHS